MGLFKKIFKPKSPDSKRFRREMAEQMCGHHIRYVTEKRNGVDEVIGRNGGLNIRDDELLVFASADVIFRCKIDDMQAWVPSGIGTSTASPHSEHVICSPAPR